ncbi:hypothetical protein F485_gp201 [Aeromonas phage CC2]|uniref:Uncharacterized protein n=1 Tax=Aeromonas phage CC2 TaxID=1204516 RepID=I6WLR8_9CAUD|nr:hypothetical protein F485_gp201 [Aeromonas phage CC2]AFN39148.1 hypothetical protein CC2_094 [Aeromonas phage CC2]
MKVRYFVWKDDKSKENWKKDFYKQLGFDLDQYKSIVDEIYDTKTPMECVMSERWEQTVDTVNGIGITGWLMFSMNDIMEGVIVEVDPPRQEVKLKEPKLVESLFYPDSGMFTAIWVEQGVIRSEDFIAEGDMVAIARMPEIKFPLIELMFPSNYKIFVIEE